MKQEPDENTEQLEGHYKKHMDKAYLGAWDLLNDDGTYSSPVVEISAIHKRQIFNPGTKKYKGRIIAALKGKKKMIILNTTNLESIEAISGTEMSHEWVGLKVKLTVKKVPDPKDRQRKAMVDAIRIERPNQKGD